MVHLYKILLVKYRSKLSFFLGFCFLAAEAFLTFASLDKFLYGKVYLLNFPPKIILQFPPPPPLLKIGSVKLFYFGFVSIFPKLLKV